MRTGVNNVLNLFSIKLRNLISGSGIDFMHLQEIRLRSGQPLILICNNKEYFISNTGIITSNKDNSFIVDVNEIRETMEYISNYSMYAFEEEIRQGFITVSGGHRVGICGKAVMENGKLKTIKYISFINIRLAHEIKGCSENIMRYLYKAYDSVYNTLIISPPMNGKTTLLRDIVRNISNGSVDENSRKYSAQKGLSVGLADERSEIAASYLGVPQNDVGIRTDVMDAMPKTYGIMMLIRTMSPDVIAVDEIGSPEDVNSILYGINCGCSFIGTIHGDSIEDVANKPALEKLISEGVFERYLLLEKDSSAGNPENGKNKADRSNDRQYGAKRTVTIYDRAFKRIGMEVL